MKKIMLQSFTRLNFLSSRPRIGVRGRLQSGSSGVSRFFWIPAFAGMTVFGAFTSSHAADRMVNHKRLAAREAAMIASVEVLGEAPTRPYELIQTLRAYDAFTAKDEQVVDLMRYEAAKLKADALFGITCTSEYWRLKTCTGKVIRWK